ncbi:MAG: FtsK/SpoIIIE domain-containing protein, partial [Propionibacteriaceae bacterium]|nr:FtsK/SpoIIIE domain-containing protein [Propionibacteriaceae bacterium]
QVRALAPDTGQLALGVEESRLGPLLFDPRADSHLFLFGDAKSGKSTFLRALAHEVMRTHTPDQAKFLVVDYRRALLGDIPAEYSAGYLTTREQASSELSELGEFLRTRLPDDSVSPEQLRSRSWWQGAEIWVLVDDYDLVATASGNPVAALQPLMSQAQDIGLHIVVTRRSGGASRAMYEPVLQTMTELSCTGILLSGNPDEGALIGRIRPRKTPAGRAQVVSRDAGCVVAQLAWVPPAH